MNRSKVNIKQWIPLIFWILLIFGLSSIPNISGEKLKLPSGSDKVVHFIEYMVFALLYYRGLSHDRKVRKSFFVLLVLMTGFALAALDEYYQRYIPGRDSSVYDIMADLIGVLVGSAIYFGFGERIGRVLDRI